MREEGAPEKALELLADLGQSLVDDGMYHHCFGACLADLGKRVEARQSLALAAACYLRLYAEDNKAADTCYQLACVYALKVSPRRTASAESIDKRSAVWAGRSPRAVAGARVCNEGPPSN